MDVPRHSYLRGSLDETDLPAEPLTLFSAWLGQAIAETGPEPTAMALATTGPDGAPSTRMVLMRFFDERGLVWFTNYESRKAKDLEHEPRAALLFYWGDLERQVRIEGATERISDAESDAYFATRPPGHRLSAWASDQSSVVPDRAFLEARMAEAEARFGNDPPRPPNWGGWRLRPDYWEFWQGRESRLHDRIAYQINDGGEWERSRLAP